VQDLLDGGLIAGEGFRAGAAGLGLEALYAHDCGRIRHQTWFLASIWEGRGSGGANPRAEAQGRLEREVQA
jgi:hypothetical protein